MHNTAELNDLALILAAAFVGGALLRTLRQPALVGYILVGAICGPTGFGLVQDMENINWLAQLGILLLMFYIGLEIDLTQFRAVARPAILTTGIQIIIGVAAMYFIGLAVGWPLKTALLLGCCVSLSSTAVVLKILDNAGLKTGGRGQISMGILIAQDIAIVPMMLILGAMKGDGAVQIMGLVKLLFGFALLMGIIFLSIKQPAWFMPWAKKFAKFKARAMQGQSAITALALCFSGAAVAGACGLSAAYGAFLAGLALGQTRSREKLHKRTRPIFDVLIMVFFLSVGLLIDLQFVARHWVLILELVGAVMVIKTLVNFVALKFQGIKAKDAFLIGAITGQIGEFSFLLAETGLGDKSLDENTYKYVVAVVSLSLMFTPLWLMFLQKTKIMPKITPSKTIIEKIEDMARKVY